MYGLPPPALLFMIGEVVLDLHVENPHFWHHVILECAAILLGVLCIIMYKLQLERRNVLHGLSMSMFWALFGYMMLMHQSSGDLREMMHNLLGILTLGVAVVRLAFTVWPKLATAYGFLLLISGMVLNFSEPVFTEYWEVVLGYPGMAYIAISLMFGFYLASLSAIIQQLALQRAEKEVIAWEDEDSVWGNSTVSTESSPLMHGQSATDFIDISKLPVIIEH